MKNIISTIQEMERKTYSFLFAAIVALAAAGANAATWYWAGAGEDLNWFTPANWNSAADGSGSAPTEEVPLASGDSFIFDAEKRRRHSRLQRTQRDGNRKGGVQAW